MYDITEEQINNMNIKEFYIFPLDQLKIVLCVLYKKYGNNLDWFLNSEGKFIILSV